MINVRLLASVGFVLLLLIAGALVAPAACLRSWLVATLCCMALPIGALPVLMTHDLSGGVWGDATRDLWRGFAATLPLLVVAMAPLVWHMASIFPWVKPSADMAVWVQRKSAYLNQPFLVLRLVIYLAIWLGIAWLQGVWYRKRRPMLGGAGLFLWLLSLTFFSVDWLMSLEPRFYSDVYGWQLSVGMICAAMAAGLLIGGRRMPANVRRDLANLWLAVLLGWAFIAFAQFIIIWSGNLPDEIGWYKSRSQAPWRLLGWISFSLFFAVPTLTLLSTSAKQQQRCLALASAACLTGWILWVHWLVLPAFNPVAPLQIWLSPALTLGLGLCFVGFIANRIQVDAPSAKTEDRRE